MKEKALRILFKAYWSERGWKIPPVVSPEDFAVARQTGVMFEPLRLAHDDLISWLKRARSAVTLDAVREAFLSSLSTRRLELRSALGSYAIARHFPDHPYQGDAFCCWVCGIFKNPVQPDDLSAYNFERYKWGGASHGYPGFTAFDLEQFHRLEDTHPNRQDIEIFESILAAARSCEPRAKPRDLERRLMGLFPSNQAERKILLQILGYCGILQPPQVASYREGYVPYRERIEPRENRFWTYPVCWWRGVHGINQEALTEYFPQFA